MLSEIYVCYFQLCLIYENDNQLSCSQLIQCQLHTTTCEKTQSYFIVLEKKYIFQQFQSIHFFVFFFTGDYKCCIETSFHRIDESMKVENRYHFMWNMTLETILRQLMFMYITSDSIRQTDQYRVVVSILESNESRKNLIKYRVKKQIKCTF